MLLFGVKPSIGNIVPGYGRPARVRVALLAALLRHRFGRSRTLRAAAPGASSTDAGIEFFEARIRPLLVKNCYECHSGQAKKIEGKLRLDSRDALRHGGESGPAVVPGDPQGSLLVRALRYEDHEMPPKGKLPSSAIADVEHWVKLGAPDPARSGGRAILPRRRRRKSGRSILPRPASTGPISPFAIRPCPRSSTPHGPKRDRSLRAGPARSPRADSRTGRRPPHAVAPRLARLDRAAADL